MRNIVYAAAGLEDSVGRVLLRSGNPVEDLTKIEELMALERIHTEPSFSAFKKDLTDLQKRRDALAHGVWVRNPETGELGVPDRSGNWNVGPAKPRLSKRMYPAANPVTAKHLEALVADIDHAAQHAHTVFRVVTTARRIVTDDAKGEVQSPPPEQR